MSAAQHTRGPLFAVRAKRCGDYAVKDAQNNIVAECYEDIRRAGESAAAEAAANAMLYAAGPDLLDAAQAAWNCIAELPPTQARVEVAQMLQAAIEKASGSVEC